MYSMLTSNTYDRKPTVIMSHPNLLKIAYFSAFSIRMILFL